VKVSQDGRTSGNLVPWYCLWKEKKENSGRMWKLVRMVGQVEISYPDIACEKKRKKMEECESAILIWQRAEWLVCDCWCRWINYWYGTDYHIDHHKYGKWEKHWWWVIELCWRCL